jgi:integrase/recombinase XerD
VTIGASDPEHRRSSNLQLGRKAPMTSDTSPRPVSPLRTRMIEDMTVRGFSEQTRSHYIRHVRSFAAFIGRSPDAATAEDLRLFQLHQTQIGMQPPSINSAVSALRFFLPWLDSAPSTAAAMRSSGVTGINPASFVVCCPERFCPLTAAASGKIARSPARAAAIHVWVINRTTISDCA